MQKVVRRMTKEVKYTSSPEDEKQIPNRKLISLPFRIIVKLISFLISLVITCCFLFITGVITDFFYAMQHPESIGVADAGSVRSVLLWAIYAFPCAFILFFILFYFFSRKLSKFIGGR